jgi:HlyD family secretion protein
VALGRLTPKGEVIKLSVSNAEDSRVNQLLVEEGDWVKAGQVIAVLQGIEGRERDLEEALKSVDYYRARLEQVRAGDAKAAEIAAQQANIARLEAQLQSETEEREAAIASAVAALRQAEINYHRKQVLQQQGAVSREELDLAQEEFEMAQATLAERRAQLSNTVQTLRQQITQEQENLARLREIRPVDVRVAQAELERAMIAVEQRRADLEDTKVRVPVAGQILRINTRVGEQVNTQQGIVELGRTDEMYAIAEVYETEIMKVRQGQRATLSSEYGGFAGKIHGTVDHIGLQIGTRTLTEASSNPTTDENTRVVEVKIRIDPQDSKAIAGLTNMQVRVEIDTTSRSET